MVVQWGGKITAYFVLYATLSEDGGGEKSHSDWICPMYVPKFCCLAPNPHKMKK